MNKEKIKKAFAQFNGFKVIVIGDAMVDAYMWGKVDRISPEAPVPIVACSQQENRLGGAANVALNIQALGASPILCSVVGDDPKGVVLRELLRAENLTAEGVFVDPSRPTTVKSRIISDNQHLLRIDWEKIDNLSPEVEAAFIQHILSLIDKHKVDAIVFEDYDKGAITPELIRRVVEKAKSNGIPTLVDPKKRNFAAYNGVTLFKPNYKELVEGLKLDVKKNDFDGIFDAAKFIHRQMGVDLVFITLSELGVFISNGETYSAIPAHMREIADVSGAGDTVISTASLCLAAGLSPEETATIANLAGGLVCEKVGVVPVNKDLLLAECLKS
ncbi:bifunctional heptose 7-phosphate kinase/heptose 1-phosphate adenyltransferase [Williamwhitmania taraxaci]|uniref:RfaE bifunctional protein, domain I n=1 Tax=Williamwhitmania taraxaci TaxID=1640674 RepID=A0A1G6LBP7_9BACT|nr:bifunctional ADP-heptose synthase [Williamwhitmania taraxaci]SDC40578.1 rfaE bifunctional protein, domain I [Williamwhitmania taraxaci]